MAPEIISNQRVMFGSNQGMIFIVNMMTRKLQSVFKVHEGSINSISISSGFCVTGGEDHYVRVWPLDFSEFHLEAKYEGGIKALSVAFDGV